jgi:hypothetical protein
MFRIGDVAGIVVLLAHALLLRESGRKATIRILTTSTGDG